MRLQTLRPSYLRQRERRPQRLAMRPLLRMRCSLVLSVASPWQQGGQEEHMLMLMLLLLLEPSWEGQILVEVIMLSSPLLLLILMLVLEFVSIRGE